MKIVVISDSHGNIANLKHVMGFAKKIKAGAVIHCGDWNTLESVETVLSFGIPLYSVLGNADIDEQITKNLKLKTKKFDESFLKFEIDGRKIGVIHDFNHPLSGIEYLGILFCGHTHEKEDRMQDGIKMINPGALKNNISFAVYDTGINKVEFFDFQHD